MIVGCYSLDLYCDCKCSERFGASQYTGETRSQCYKAARGDGWVLTRDRKAICPTCNKAGRKPIAPTPPDEGAAK